jgi:hypothetical protein
MLLQGGAHGGERGVIAELGIELAMIDDVVAVGAAGTCLEVGRQVRMADAQPPQIRRQLRDSLKAEALLQLQAIGGARDYGEMPVGFGIRRARSNAGSRPRACR